jgi:hypothetical protein
LAVFKPLTVFIKYRYAKYPHLIISCQLFLSMCAIVILLIRSGPQLESTRSKPLPVVEELTTLPAVYTLPQKISIDHYRPPSPPAIVVEETRSQNLTSVVADRLTEPAAVSTASHQRLNQNASHSPLLNMLAAPTLSAASYPDLPAYQLSPSLTDGRPSCSSVPGADMPQNISFRHQQADLESELFSYRA